MVKCYYIRNREMEGGYTEITMMWVNAMSVRLSIDTSLSSEILQQLFSD